MVRRAMLVVCFALMAVFMTSCGQTYKLTGLQVTPGTLTPSGASTINLEGQGAFQQLTVTATFSNSKTQDVTQASTFGQIGDSALGEKIAPLESLTVVGGFVKVVGYACTWDTEPTDPPTNSKFSYGIAPYSVNISYTDNGITKTTQAFVNVNNDAGFCYDPTNPAPTGFAGNQASGY